MNTITCLYAEVINGGIRKHLAQSEVTFTMDRLVPKQEAFYDAKANCNGIKRSSLHQFNQDLRYEDSNKNDAFFRMYTTAKHLKRDIAFFDRKVEARRELIRRRMSHEEAEQEMMDRVNSMGQPYEEEPKVKWFESGM